MNVLFWLFKSSKTEIKIVLATLATLIIIPVFTVVVFAASGLSLIGDALAAINPITHLVEIFDPNGNRIAELELSTTWPSTGYVSDEFGANQQWRSDRGLGPHSGIDIANEWGLIGEPVTPFMVGTILYNDDTDDSPCGKNVKVQHEFNITSQYCHLDSTTNITYGIKVRPGDIIGYMGSSGSSTGSHVHMSIYVYGINVNPRTFMVGEPERTEYDSPTF